MPPECEPPWTEFGERCQNVCALLRFMLTLLDKNTIAHGDGVTGSDPRPVCVGKEG